MEHYRIHYACCQQGANCTDAKLCFWTIFQFFFYPNETWTHPPTSNFFLDFWNFFNFAKPLRSGPGPLLTFISFSSSVTPLTYMYIVISGILGREYKSLGFGTWRLSLVKTELYCFSRISAFSCPSSRSVYHFRYAAVRLHCIVFYT